MTDTLVQFLRDRLDEDERIAQDAGGYSIETMDGAFPREKYLVLRGDHPDRFTMPLSADLAKHIARHDPARVLADVEAKRRVIDGHTADFHWCPMGDNLFKVLALPYADHPGYREEWRP